MNIRIAITELNDDGRYLAEYLFARDGQRPASTGEVLHVEDGCGVFCRDLLTFGDRARKFGLACPVNDLEAYIASVERMFGPEGHGREWRLYHLPGWQRMTDAERVNGLGAALRTFASAGHFSPVKPVHDPVTERVLTALFGG